MKLSRKSTPASRPLRLEPARELKSRLLKAFQAADGFTGAHCIHELWMRGEISANIEITLKKLWETCADSVPDWLPMRHIDWLPRVYEVAAQIEVPKVKAAKGRSNIYLILLDYTDSRSDSYGIYVGMSGYKAAERFDQHKAGIRSAGSVLKRGLEPLIGPVMHLQNIKRTNAERIEAQLAEALTAAGLFVHGGH